VSTRSARTGAEHLGRERSSDTRRTSVVAFDPNMLDVDTAWGPPATARVADLRSTGDPSSSKTMTQSQDRPTTVRRSGADDAAGPRRRLILVCGLGGTGKTTLADLLSRELNVACLHKDDVKTALHDGGIETPRSFQIFRTLVERQLANRIDLIIEATMHEPADWGLLSRWQEAYDLDLICVVCSAEKEERERRIRTRDRHPAHAAADRRQLAELDVVVDYSQLPGRHIDISTRAEPHASAQEVLAELG
jgi:predicted kinase